MQDAGDGRARLCCSGMIGIDAMSGYIRFNYGVVELGDGIGIVPVAVGLFGISEILLTARTARPAASTSPSCASCCLRAPSWRASVAPDRARHRARLSDRHHPRLRATSSRRSCPMRSSGAFRSIRSDSARARSKASPDRSRPTTPRRSGALRAACWRSACPRARSPRSCSPR